MASALFADSRLGRVTELTRDVSNNAMPSLADIGTMRRELADVRFTLEEAAEGNGGDLSSLDEHLRELESARRSYEMLPQFPAEPAVWARVSPALDEVSRVATRVAAEVNAGALAEARADVTRNLVPAEGTADAALLQLRAINLEEGTRSARRAEHAWARTREVSLVLFLACTALTGGLAFLALRGTRQYLASEERRATELDAFASRVAHDIRGPLTPPLFALQRLARELDPASPFRPMVERGVRGLQRAEVLVRDLLMFARAAAAPDTYARASLPEVVAGVVQDVEPESSAAHVRVDVANLPASDVCCAPGVLSSVVGNLVSNAVKYMPPDAKERLVCIRAFEVAKGVHVEVSDTGAGLPGDATERIFNPFVRADASRPGLGLGLATVKRLVQAHGGRLGVQSRAGGGSVFWFELPRRQALGA